MTNSEVPLDADELMNLADRIERLPAVDAGKAARLEHDAIEEDVLDSAGIEG